MTFFDQAREGRKTHWPWYVMALGILFISFVVGQIPLIALVQHKVRKGFISLEAAQTFYDSADFQSIGISSALGLLLLLISFVYALIALFIIMRYVHGRRFRSLISARPVRWDKIGFAAIIWLFLTGAGELVLYLMYPGTYHFVPDWKAWIPVVLIALLILPLQTSFEELLVRGYLMQKFGVMTQRPWIAIVLSSLFFASMHLGNPEITEFGLGTMMTYYISVALALAVITVLDDGLEYALGIHAATNIYGATFVSYEGSALQTDALFRVDTVDPLMMIIMFYVMILIFILISRYRKGLKHWSVLFRKLRIAASPVEQNTLIANSENSSIQ